MTMQPPVSELQNVYATPTKQISTNAKTPCKSMINSSCVQSVRKRCDTIGSTEAYGTVLRFKEADTFNTPAQNKSSEHKTFNVHSVVESPATYGIDSNQHVKTTQLWTESIISISAEDKEDIAKLDDTADFFAAITHEKQEIISWEEKLNELVASFIADFDVDFDAVSSNTK
mmetsp:Transcript_8861/g.18899  ORF Transcript_8861/g.18899 Transcript_8861/m.18899 type:complete len:172 (-) Transcript_8861:49-564(-)